MNIDNNQLIRVLRNKNITVLQNKVRLDDILNIIIKTKNKSQYIKRNFTKNELINIKNNTNRKEAKDILKEIELLDDNANYY